MKVIDRKVVLGNSPVCLDHSVDCSIEKQALTIHETVYNLSIDADTVSDQGVEIKWKFPCNNIKGVWTTNALHEKRLRADWELPVIASRISVDAPVVSIYDHLDDNILTFAVSDCINTVELEASIQEEDGCIYCIVRLLTEPFGMNTDYKCSLYISYAPIAWGESVKKVGQWWASEIEVANIPVETTFPVYSTWYSYHQDFKSDDLLKECRLAKELGYKGIIVDDGWQTVDDGRGYDYTGDWEIERIRDIKHFVDTVHEYDMYCMFWFSVPFCGKKSKAYVKFKGKFLTESHPWAPVFDPRYPEVRSHLVSRYSEAIGKWNLDGLKLDFIDDFKLYPETNLKLDDGKDCLSVNEGVKKLIDETKAALYEINPNVLIEFRQKYTGPYLQTIGNMFRAFDAPYDSLTNRIRTTDVKLLAGATSTHSDMIAWHSSEDVEVAALQLTNVLFSVPQLSVRLEEQSPEHLQMIAFYTKYFNEHIDILLHGEFVPFKPSSNYPILSSFKEQKIIFGLYENHIIEIQPGYKRIDIVNGKMTEQVAFEVFEEMKNVKVKIYDCMGEVDWNEMLDFDSGIHALEVPPNGLLTLSVTQLNKVL